jgi:hypothetical protein
MQLDVSFPLDDDGFLRRECPLCNREFKMKPTSAELRSEAEHTTHAMLAQAAEPSADDEADAGEVRDRWCPYCGQQAPTTSWWTQEQVAYLSVFARNIMARLVNEHLVRPMKRSLGGAPRGGLFSIEFKGSEMEEQEPWIAPEPNDMSQFALPCCNRELKITNAAEEVVHCFFCGFPHPNRGRKSDD